jgi:hypothetical protein
VGLRLCLEHAAQDFIAAMGSPSGASSLAGFSATYPLWMSNMECDAVQQANVHLRRARKAFSALEKAKAYDDAQDSWGTFLAAADGIYEVLKDGAEKNGKSAAWFGRMKHIRKKDELLSYIHQARNADHTVLNR